MTHPTMIVALGASNTAGYGVGTELAYPAVLEALLRARGMAVTVHNTGISGNTTAEMLSRLDAVLTLQPRVLLFQPGSNDQRRRVPASEREQNITTITNIAERHGTAVLRVADAFAAARAGNLQPDGIHYTAAGHRRIAELLMVDVLAALGQAG